MNKCLFEIVKDLKVRCQTVKDGFDFDAKKLECEELRLRREDPDFWSDQEAAIKVNQHFVEMDSMIKSIEKIESETADVETALAMNEDEEIFSEEELRLQTGMIVKMLSDIEFQLMFNGEADALDAELKIVAGAGGTEAQDWAYMLARMYDMWSSKHGFSCDKFNWQDGDIAGIKTCTLTISGKNAYGLLKTETGVHRLVRVSPFNAQGKRMTSFASVFVIPIIDDSFQIDIDESKVTYDYFRCSGAGGQNVNKVNSGVRLHYLYKDPYTGEEEEIIVENTETRDQPKNKENCKRHLKSILYDKELKHREEEKRKIEDSKSKIEWGAQIRSYVFDDQRVKDHRTGYQTSDVAAVMDGNIDDFIKAALLKNKK